MRLGVVLVPNKAIQREAIRLNRAISCELGATLITLGGVALPHISLSQVTTNPEELLPSFKEFSKLEFPYIYLQMAGAVVPHGTRFFWNVRNPDEIVGARQPALVFLNGIRDGYIPPYWLERLSELNQQEIISLDYYGFPFALNPFYHITVAKTDNPNQYSPEDINHRFRVNLTDGFIDRVSLVELDKRWAVVRELVSVEPRKP